MARVPRLRLWTRTNYGMADGTAKRRANKGPREQGKVEGYERREWGTYSARVLATASTERWGREGAGEKGRAGKNKYRMEAGQKSRGNRGGKQG